LTPRDPYLVFVENEAMEIIFFKPIGSRDYDAARLVGLELLQAFPNATQVSIRQGDRTVGVLDHSSD